MASWLTQNRKNFIEHQFSKHQSKNCWTAVIWKVTARAGGGGMQGHSILSVQGFNTQTQNPVRHFIVQGLTLRQ